MKIIAHAVKNYQEAQRSFEGGIDFIEVDVSKRIFSSKFVIQHNGVWGKLGIGPNLASILTDKIKSRLFLDIKHANISLNFSRKLSVFLKNASVGNIRVCGLNWEAISQICKTCGLAPYYTLTNRASLKRFRRVQAKLYRAAGFSIRHNLIDKTLIKNLKADYPKSDIWAWTVNDVKKAKELFASGIDGIITDNWRQLSTINFKLETGNWKQ